MPFQLIPILDSMIELYQQPISPDRFTSYISKLQGDRKGELSLPISSFNPMAKDHALLKLLELRDIDAEGITSNVIKTIKSPSVDSVVEVVLNVADDVAGGWTNHYTVDFDSKFKINALVERRFCTPLFWTSEEYTEELIIQRVQEYVWRTIFWLGRDGRLRTLQDHLDQERFVLRQMKTSREQPMGDLSKLLDYYEQHKESDDYSLIFNFFYSDEVCQSLGYPSYGVAGATGFDLVKL